ncbi:MAG: hypothetical protein QOD67_1524 [Caballeronia sp.]|nr:hypothetical protein [Caballeronia sp.]
MRHEPQSSEHRFRYGDETIRFRLRRQPMRTGQRIAIHVETDGRVLVDAPPDASLEKVLVAVKKRARWICSHLLTARTRLAQILPREYVSGESLRYIGRRYRLKVLFDSNAKADARMRGGFIAVTVPQQSPELIRSVLDQWYRGRAQEVFAHRLETVAAPLRWVPQPPPMRLQFMRLQWGSCSPAGRITLNPLWVKAPRECIDYVVLHELCHLLHHNHSSQFYRTLDRQMPQWRTVKEKLDNMAEEVFCA